MAILDPGKIFSVWKSDDVAKRFAELARQTDYDKLVGGYRSLEKWAVTEGYAMPLLQGTMTVVHKRTLGYTPFANGSNRPYYWRLA